MTSAVETKHVHVNGVDLAYVEQGSGEPLIFVHGSLNDYRSWTAQMAPFGERYRVIAYSRRYHWPNAGPAADARYAVAQHTADLAALIETLGLAPAHLVGSSYGAMTSLTMASQRPELAHSLVLGEPPLLPWLAHRPGGPAVLEAFLTHAFQPAGEAFAQGEAEEGIRLFLAGVLGPSAYDRLPAAARAMMLDNAAAMALEPRTAPEAYFGALTRPAVEQLHAPTLLVQGAVSPPMFGMILDELAAHLPIAERVVIPNASHSMHTMNPTTYNEAVLAFLAGH